MEVVVLDSISPSIMSLGNFKPREGFFSFQSIDGSTQCINRVNQNRLKRTKCIFRHDLTCNII